MRKKKINGYYLACRLLFVMFGEIYQHGFHNLCLLFGPLGWDLLTDQQKVEIKQLAARYRMSAAWQHEKTMDGHLNAFDFVNAVFESEHERDYFYKLLSPAHEALI